MFAYISGKLAFKTPMQVVVDVNGIGFDILIPLKTFDKLPEKGQMVTLFIHFSLTESEGIRLFGFSTDEEKKLFRALISISKIGPKIGISILSALTPHEFYNAIQLNDVAILSSVPGLGKKTSERLIIELKDKIGKMDLIKFPAADSKNTMLLEAETALNTLGYKTFAIRNTMNQLLKNQEFNSSEEMIKAVIKYLYKAKK